MMQRGLPGTDHVVHFTSNWAQTLLPEQRSTFTQVAIWLNGAASACQYEFADAMYHVAAFW